MTISIPPNFYTAFSTHSLTSFSCLISHFKGKAFPPNFSISSAAVKIVPGKEGCGSVVFANITILAPS